MVHMFKIEVTSDVTSTHGKATDGHMKTHCYLVHFLLPIYYLMIGGH
jgi:hypothetical protein